MAASPISASVADWIGHSLKDIASHRFIALFEMVFKNGRQKWSPKYALTIYIVPFLLAPSLFIIGFAPIPSIIKQMILMFEHDYFINSIIFKNILG